MYTRSGREVFPHTDIAPSLEDIAVALGRIPRFAGHTDKWYPVLAHTLVCAEFAEPGKAIHLLLHDAPEACVSDVPTPWKTQGAEDHEYDLLGRIYKEHEIEWPWSPEIAAEVKRVDRLALAAEVKALGYPGPTDWLGVEARDDMVEATLEYMRVAQRMIDPVYSIPLFLSQVARAKARL